MHGLGASGSVPSLFHEPVERLQRSWLRESRVTRDRNLDRPEAVREEAGELRCRDERCADAGDIKRAQGSAVDTENYGQLWGRHNTMPKPMIRNTETMEGIGAPPPGSDS